MKQASLESALPGWTRTGVVAVGTLTGATARWGVMNSVDHATDRPVMLAVNIVGSVVVGALAGRQTDQPENHLRLLFGVGFCGGLTTFSGFAVDVALLIDNGDAVAGLTTTAFTLCAVVAAASIGYHLRNLL